MCEINYFTDEVLRQKKKGKQVSKNDIKIKEVWDLYNRGLNFSFK